jgi:N-acylneuraminate cytidylyltransferase
LESQLFEHVLVSTDDDQIAEAASSMGAQTPFIRPADLSDDHCATLPVIQHAITWAQSNWGSLDYVCTLYATAPFVTSHVLTAAYQQLIEQPQKEYAFGVCPFPSPIQRAFRKTANQGVEMFNPEYFNTRSQDLEEAFFDAGQFYWGKTDAFLKGLNMFENHSLPIVLPQHLVQDIDTLDDWLRAEAMFKANNSIKGTA